MSSNFIYTDAILTSLEAVLSVERLTNYLSIAHGDRKKAIQLYLWNAELNGALQIPIHIVEVAVRNTIHQELSKAFGPTWYDNHACPIKPSLRQVVQDVKDTLVAEGKPVIPPRIVAGLTMAFWVFLLSKRYETPLWRSHLYNAFPNSPKPFSRSQARRSLEHIRLLRNRVAHHEPILGKSPDQTHMLILNVVGWISIDTAAWLRHYSRFEKVWNDQP